MRATLIPLLALLLLAGACRQAPPPPPPPPQDPPAEGPLRAWLENGTLVLQNTMPGQIEAQIYVLPPDGSWRNFVTGLAYSAGGDGIAGPISRFQIREGRLEVWAQDVSSFLIYGGRRFRWVYPFRFDDSGPQPRLILPDGPVSFEVLDRFPWGEAHPLDRAAIGALRTVSVSAAFQLCLHQPFPSGSKTLEAGLWGQVYTVSGMDDPQAYYNQLTTYLWEDNRFTGNPTGSTGTFNLGPVINDSESSYIDGRPHAAVMISKSYGIGRYRQPWEGRWFRAFNRGYRGWREGDGTVRCEFGEGWRVEEVTDPAELALMEEYERNGKGPGYINRPPYPLYTPLDGRLCPTPWRRGDGSCDWGTEGRSPSGRNTFRTPGGRSPSGLAGARAPGG